MSDSEPSLDSFFPNASDTSTPPITHKHESFELSHPIQGVTSIPLRMVSRHVLWGDHLWNGALWTAKYILDHPDIVRYSEGKSRRVLELGAGAGLPSLICALLGASVIVTDYPDHELISNLDYNIDKLRTLVDTNQGDAKLDITARGYLWGSSTEHLVSTYGLFDIVILSDVVFNHSEHDKLIWSCKQCLKEGGLVVCAFTHYRPHLAHKDLAFLEKAQAVHGNDKWVFRVEKVEETMMPEVMFPLDRGDAEVRRTVHAYFMYKEVARLASA